MTQMLKRTKEFFENMTHVRDQTYVDKLQCWMQIKSLLQISSEVLADLKYVSVEILFDLSKYLELSKEDILTCMDILSKDGDDLIKLLKERRPG